MQNIMFTAGILMALLAPLAAQEAEVDHAQVLRLGDVVQHVGGGHRAGDADAYVTAMSPPASDADKWFISVISMKSCSGCEKLKRDWSSSSALLSLADPADAARSWSHYNVYDRDDRSQMFRFANIKVSAYPTILVQPPRSGKYGEPGTVVFQSVYGGDPEKLARGIADAIRRYVSKLPDDTHRDVQQLAGSNPPWQPVPKVEPVPGGPQVQPAPFDPTIPPEVPSVTPFPWSSLLALLMGGISTAALAAMGVWLLQYLRAKRHASGKSPLLDPVTVDRLLKELQRLTDEQRAGASR